MTLYSFAYFYGTRSQENCASEDGFRTKTLQGEKIFRTGENDGDGDVFSVRGAGGT